MNDTIKHATLPIRKIALKKNGTPRRCNLCAELFVPRSMFDRYCPDCKNGSELLKFSNWLPEIGDEVYEKIAA